MRIEIDGGVLLVSVEERPAIAQIDFVGLKEFDKDQLTKGLKDAGFAVSAPLTAVCSKSRAGAQRQGI